MANALADRNIAKAQIAALLLQLPDPPLLAYGSSAESDRIRLAYDLTACGLLKADDDWGEKHPRTGTAPNPGWFAPKPGVAEDSAPSGPADSSGEETASAPALAADTGSLLAEGLSPISLEGLATLAGRFSVPSVLFGAIFVPSSNGIVDEGPVPGRPDMTYHWAHDETTATFQGLINGQWRTLTVGTLGEGGLFRDPQGEVVARLALAPGQPPTLITTTDALDRAEARLLRQDGQPVSDTTGANDAPKLCPDPTPEPKTTKSQNSIAYQEYVSGLPYGLAINVGSVNFDGGDDKTGILLEAKANIDLIIDANDTVYGWVYDEKNPRLQVDLQASTAQAAGRVVVWHAQTLKGYQGLSIIAQDLGWTNLFVVYDPN